MKIKCITNTGEYLSEISIQAGEFKETKFNIDIGKIYIVYCMSKWKGSLNYLLAEKCNDIPIWYPVELFEISDPLLPLEWYFTFKGYEINKALEAIWGYKEMISDPKHYIDLLECEPEALEIFYKRKKEIDEYEALRI